MQVKRSISIKNCEFHPKLTKLGMWLPFCTVSSSLIRKWNLHSGWLVSLPSDFWMYLSGRCNTFQVFPQCWCCNWCIYSNTWRLYTKTFCLRIHFMYSIIYFLLNQCFFFVIMTIRYEKSEAIYIMLLKTSIYIYICISCYNLQWIMH